MNRKIKKGSDMVNEMHWIKKMNVKKGAKAFQKVSDPMVKSKLVNFTEWQNKLINDYCRSKGVTFSDMVRVLFAKAIKEDNYSEQLSEADKRQLELFD